MIRHSAACLLIGLCFSAAAQAEETPPSPSPSGQFEAHLASYRHKADAERGWSVLTESYSSVLYFHPAIHEIDLPGKGHYFRLFADGDQSVMASLCQSMHERKLYCVLMPADH